MALPIRLVWNLQMPRRKKAAICLLFGLALVCIAFATIRVMQIGINDRGQASSPEAKWLAFWSVLELSVGVIVGCCPAFASLIRARRNSKRKSSRGYLKQSGESSGAGSAGLRLKTIVSSKPKSTEGNTVYGRSHSSQEQLATSPLSITITTALHQTESVTALSGKS